METACLVQDDHTGDVLLEEREREREQSGEKPSSTRVVDFGIYQLEQYIWTEIFGNWTWNIHLHS